MIEQYVYNLIVADTTLQTLLDNGNGGYHLYPTVVPKTINTDIAVTFSLISTVDAYPTVKSVQIQFNIFAPTHQEVVEMAQALNNLLNEDNHKSSGGVNVIYSQRSSEADLGYNFDDKVFQRQATYYFKLR